MRAAAAIDLYWLPLGAGGSYVRANGRVFEALAARVERRAPLALYHSALVVAVPEGRFAIEVAPVAAGPAASRGAVSQGAVGSVHAGRWRIFRYELRCWRDGTLPDIAEAVDSPRRLSGDLRRARRLLGLAAAAPMPVWGRDELRTGEMWTCNSTIAWLLGAAGLPAEPVRPPAGGRAPGWRAGVIAAQRIGSPPLAADAIARMAAASRPPSVRDTDKETAVPGPVIVAHRPAPREQEPA
jgi:hypothetical protein